MVSPPSRVSTIVCGLFRAQQEQNARLHLLILIVGLVIVMGLVAHVIATRLPSPTNSIILVIFLLWLLGPFAWIGWTALQIRSKRMRAIIDNEQRPFPERRRDPRVFVNQLSQLLHLPSVPAVVLVDGDGVVTSIQAMMTLRTVVAVPYAIPIIRSRVVGYGIIIPIGLYEHALDDDIEMLLLHEVGHLVAGHGRLDHLAQAALAEKMEQWVKTCLFPLALISMIIAAWRKWSDTTADRFMCLVRSDYALAERCVYQFAIIQVHHREPYTMLVNYLRTGSTPTELGEKMALGAEYTNLCADYPWVATRISEIRAWLEDEEFPRISAAFREHLTQSATTTQ